MARSEPVRGTLGKRKGGAGTPITFASKNLSHKWSWPPSIDGWVEITKTVRPTEWRVCSRMIADAVSPVLREKLDRVGIASTDIQLYEYRSQTVAMQFNMRRLHETLTSVVQKKREEIMARGTLPTPDEEKSLQVARSCRDWEVFRVW